MSGTVRQPSVELLRVAGVIDQMIDEYRRALRSVASMGPWEAPREGIALGWLLIRNVEAVAELARRDEVLVTAAWSNTRVAFELSTRIIWMLQPADRYEAECRWLSLLGEYEEIERKLAREVPSNSDLHNGKAEAIGTFREGVIAALPSGYRVLRMPSFLSMLNALDTSEMYQYYRQGSQYVHGGMYASASYSKDLGSYRILSDFTSTVDWVLPMRLCWLSLRNASRSILDRLEVTEQAMPQWGELKDHADIAFRALAFYATQPHEPEAADQERRSAE
jgi:hypothetical protein